CGLVFTVQFEQHRTKITSEIHSKKVMVFLTQKVLLIIAYGFRFVQRKEDIFGTFVCHFISF
ncbi:MAG: hypothetical protein K2P73_20790, partial [Lachnospiraceae bacterium]|nr:hypothetical protein [Lachnospiraceae bacterium]